MAAAVAGEEWAQPEEPAQHFPHADAGQEAEAAHDGPLHTLMNELRQENDAWSIEGMDTWDWTQEAIYTPASELTARRRFWEETELDEKSTYGADMRVDLYHPDNLGQKWQIPFMLALEHVYTFALEVFKEVEGEPDELKKLSNCIYQLVSLFSSLMQFRWQYFAAFPAFQWMLDMLARPHCGLIAVVRDWVRASPEDRPARQAKMEGQWHWVLTKGFEEVREVRRFHHVADVGVLMFIDYLIGDAQKNIYQPPQELLRTLPNLPKPTKPKTWSLDSLTRILVEMRAAWTEPRLQRRRKLLERYNGDPSVYDAGDREIIKDTKSGRFGCFHRHYDILERHGLAPSAEGVRAFSALLASRGKEDVVLRHLCLDVITLLQGGPVAGLPVACEALTPGRRVWAFYDTYMQNQQWRYRYVKVEAPPSGWPLIGLAAGWLQGTIVAKPETSTGAMDGFMKVRVRFDGYFSDTRDVARALEIKATKNENFIDGGKYGGRFCSENKEFMIPATLIRDIDDPPEQPLLSVLNLRPVDYYSFPKHSDYNICNDGYIQDMFHGPCSMREQIQGEYEVWAVFIKDTANLDRLDAQHLRSLLTGRNIIGWYLQWPQVLSKSIWGNGSVRKQQFFNFCARAERAQIRMGWPHESHIYELLAGKIWIPRMSLCKDFKTPPSTYIDYAGFKRNGPKTARRALEHIMHLRRVVWNAPPMDVDAFKGVVKFGYSWCGTDVTPFVGLEALVKAVDGMFHKEGNEQTTIIVQEMLPNVFAECRNLCFYDRLSGSFHKERLWVAQMQKTASVEGFSGMASSNVIPSNDVGKNCLAGDFDALRSAETEVDLLCDRWLKWLRTESPSPVQCVRIDFLVAKGDGPGQAKVWTCEVGECGGSLCSLEVHPRNTVALNNAVRNDPSGRFPVPLHRPLPRNDGVKSH